MKDQNHNIKLIYAAFSDYSIIQNMGRFYVYDITEYMGAEKGWEIPENGLFECIDFNKYWEQPNIFPFIIRINHEIVGFVIVDKKGSDNQVDFNMAQFFILINLKSKVLAVKSLINVLIALKERGKSW